MKSTDLDQTMLVVYTIDRFLFNGSFISEHRPDQTAKMHKHTCSSKSEVFFQPDVFWVFFFLHENVCCGYHLEVPSATNIFYGEISKKKFS